MNELKITDAIGRQLQPGNVIALNVLMTGGHVFCGFYVIIALEYRNNGEESWAIEMKHRNLNEETRKETGDWYEGKCYGHGNLILKLAENEASLHG